MQTIFEDEDERGNGKRADVLNSVTYAGRISRYLERKCNGGTGGEGNRI